MKKPNQKTRILMIVENAYPADSRVRKEATALKERHDVTVISLKRTYKMWHETVDGVEVLRVPEIALAMNSIKNRFAKLLVSIVNYALQYSWFTLMSAGLFLLTHIRRRYKVLHVHNPPDTLFAIGLLGKLLRVRFVYDHHDLAPELYLSRFNRSADSAHAVLMMFERLSCRLADVIIATNHSYKHIETTRHGIEPSKIYIVRNDPVIGELSENTDTGERAAQRKKKMTIMYLGSINPQDGVDGLMDILSYLVNDLGEQEIVCRIVGDGDSVDTVKARAAALQLLPFLEFTGYIYDRRKIKEYLAQADVCVEPAPDNRLNRHSTFIKIMEYMAAGKPIVAFDLPETRYSTEGCALLANPGDNAGFAKNIQHLVHDAPLRNELGNKGADRTCRQLNWNQAATQLMAAYDSLNIKDRADVRNGLASNNPRAGMKWFS